jgi:hypothetical protein
MCVEPDVEARDAGAIPPGDVGAEVVHRRWGLTSYLPLGSVLFLSIKLRTHSHPGPARTDRTGSHRPVLAVPVG